MPTSYDSTTYTSSDCTATWNVWVDQSSATTNNITWDYWTSGSRASDGLAVTVAPTYTLPSLTEEQIEERDRAQLEKVRKKKDAEDRAEILLKSCLNEEQRKGLEEMTSFVMVSELGYLYRIKKGRVANIERINDKGEVVSKWCAHPREVVPDFDTMLTQKLWLETDERAFLQIANRHPS